MSKIETNSAPRRGEMLRLAPLYFFLALMNLIVKLRATPTWFDGTLDGNHRRLMAGDYTNNEQSRVLQYAVPEALRTIFGLSIGHAYSLQRFAFVWLAFVLFHLYLRRWFPRAAALAGVLLLAALMPFTYRDHLQESAALLMPTFLLGLWAARAGSPGAFAAVLFLGALNNETVLVLPAVWFFFRLEGTTWPAVRQSVLSTLLVAAPAVAITIFIRYLTRHAEHLGGAFHLPDNLGGIVEALLTSPFDPPLNGDYLGPVYLAPFLIFGPLWVYAYLGWSDKPRFVRATLSMTPFFLAAHLVTGIIAEVRQMIPLAFIIIPAAFFYLLDDRALESQSAK